MVKDRFGIVVCSKFRLEFKKALEDLGEDDVRLMSYQSECGSHLDPEQSLANIRSKMQEEVDDIEVIAPHYCVFCQSKDKTCQYFDTDTCTEYFIPKTLMNSLVGQGAYVITPGWLYTWQNLLENVWGFKQEQSRSFFQEKTKEIVVLDTMVHADYEPALKAFSKYVDLPFRVIQIGLEFLTLKLRALLDERAVKRVKRDFIERGRKERVKLSKISMAFDLIPRLLTEKTEEGVLEVARQMLFELFAPSNVAVLLPTDRGEIGVYRPLKMKIPDGDLQVLFQFKGDFCSVPERSLLLLKIIHQNHDLAYFVAEDFAFPEHLKDYEEIIELLSSFLSLLLFSARQQDKLAETSNKLAVQNETVLAQNEELSTTLEELQLSQESLMEANDQLHTANKTKDKFFSIIAHDLRSPFNALLGFSNLLTEDYEALSDAERKEYLGHMQNTVQSTFNLLNDLLSWSRSQRGVIPFKPQTIKLGDKANQIIGELEQNLSLKNLRIHNSIPKSASILADPDMVTVVARNLLGNAIKFSHEGAFIELGFDYHPDGAQFWVKDSGVGISEERQEHLFDIGASETTLGTKNEKGSGLGLVLCREFMEKHQGTITVQSTLGEGSRFICQFPHGYSENGKS